MTAVGQELDIIQTFGASRCQEEKIGHWREDRADGGQHRMILIVCSEIAHLIAPPRPFSIVRTAGGGAGLRAKSLKGPTITPLPALVVRMSHTKCRFHAVADHAHLAVREVRNGFRDAFRSRTTVHTVLAQLNDDTLDITVRDGDGGCHPLSEIRARRSGELFRGVHELVAMHWSMPERFKAPLRLFMSLNHPRTQRLCGIMGGPGMKVSQEALPPVVGISLNGGLLPLGLTEKVSILDYAGQEPGSFRDQIRQLTASAFHGIEETPAMLISNGYHGDPLVHEERNLALVDLLHARSQIFSAVPALPAADNLQTILALYDFNTKTYEIVKS